MRSRREVLQRSMGIQCCCGVPGNTLTAPQDVGRLTRHGDRKDSAIPPCPGKGALKHLSVHTGHNHHGQEHKEILLSIILT